VPVLARTLEAAGLSTILVTMMPFWVEKTGAPRTLAVEYPFGHTLGIPHDVAGQRRIIFQALEVLEQAQSPGVIVHSPEKWSQPTKEAIDAWQPAEPSPIIKEITPRLREMIRSARRRS
jgi:hypothetical protein